MDIIQFIVNQLEKPIKMIMFRFNFDKSSCRHCEGMGTCTKGFDSYGVKYSCRTCIRFDDPKIISSSVKVSCSVCNGTGREESYISERKSKLAAKDYKKLEA